MSEFDDDFDLDFDLAVEVPAMSENGAPLDGGGPRKELFIFQPVDGEAGALLASVGIHGVPATTGSEIMAAAQEGRLGAVVVSPTTDGELRELFIRALRGRFRELPVIYLDPKADDPTHNETLRAEGATKVLPWPPDRARLQQSLEELLPQMQAFTPAPSRASEDELALLARKLPTLPASTASATSSNDHDAQAELERAKREAAERDAENTSLRSELTVTRQRTVMLEERLARLTSDFSEMMRERDELKGRLEMHAEPTVSREDLQERLSSIKKIGDGAESFLWGLEQATQFLEDLQLEAGDHRAPTLATHLRSIKMVRMLLERIRDRTRDL